MATMSLKFEDILEVASNFLPWKIRVTLLLEDNDLLDVVNDVVATPTYLWQLATNKRK
jgi:hypothetical protein